MTLSNNSNIKHILSMENITTLSLEILIDSQKLYPYSAVTQFMLAKKMYHQNDVHFSKQVQQTAIHFNKTNWLEYQLIHEEKNVFSSVKSNHYNQTIVEATLTTDEFIPENVVSIEIPIETIPTTEIKISEEITSDITVSLTSFALAASEEIQMPEIHTKDEPIEHSEVVEDIEDDSLNIDLKIASSLEKQLSDFNKPVDENTELIITTEPYHTVDYFASQGIKVEIDPNAQDKLTKQVRKFTDWLKQMKTIPATETAVLDTELENEIQLIANDSNETKEVVTETMAEVFEKQGKISKAIVLYEKLSFLNPDKSTYFANKIQQLKNK